MKTVAISGGFDPLHNGHIDLITEAKKLGDRLICILNTDDFLTRKKGRPFQVLAVRKKILEHIREIDEVIVSIDNDQTVCRTLEMIKPHIFANGGDRKAAKDIPEALICQQCRIKMVFNVGGNKINSSSELLRRW